MSQTPVLPYTGIRVVELGTLMSGRISSLLLSDQGADVYILADQAHASSHAHKFNTATNAYLNRGKTMMSGLTSEQRTSLIQSADVVVVDGESTECVRSEKQILLRICAALPGDTEFGHLPHDCDDDFLNCLVGIFTDMASSHFLERRVIYTPVQLCSVYAGVIGAVSTAAALVDRESSGLGREIHTSRLASGVSAIGALSLTIDGPNLPKHLVTPKISH